MGKAHLNVLLAVGVIVAIAAVYLYKHQERRDTETAAGPKPLFENLNLEEVAEVEIITPAETVKLKGAEDKWGLATRGGYPVNPETLRRLVLTVASLEAADEMTDNPEKYDRLGVGETPEKGQVRFLDKEGKELASLYVGKERQAPAASPGGFAPTDGQYIRKVGDPKVYVIKEALRIDTTPGQWLQRELLKVEEAQIQQISVENRGTTDSFTLARTGEDPFQIVTAIPEGLEPKPRGTNAITGALANLNLEDVLPSDDPKISQIDFSTSFTATLKNGLLYELGAGELEGSHYLLIDARYDPALDLSKSDERTSDSVTASAMELPDVTLKRVQEQKSGWVYKIPSYQYNNLAQIFSDLLQEKKEEPPPDLSEAPAASPSEDSETGKRPAPEPESPRGAGGAIPPPN